MRNPDSFPTCSHCGDVVIYCKCIEKHNDKMMKRFQNGNQCPECLTKDSIVKIQYGYPSNEGIIKADKGEIKLGGCTIDDNNTDYHCNNCNYEWKKNEPYSGYYVKEDN